jgi:hypothetical protein
MDANTRLLHLATHLRRGDDDELQIAPVAPRCDSSTSCGSSPMTSLSRPRSLYESLAMGVLVPASRQMAMPGASAHPKAISSALIRQLMA